MAFRPVSFLFLSLFSGCAGIAPEGVPVAMYERVGEAFQMITREDGEGGNATWGQGSGVAVEDGGRHFIYTARHVLLDKTNDGALPAKLYATTLDGKSFRIEFSNLEIPEDNRDAVRMEIPEPVCRELRLANRPPRYGERLYFFGDAKGAGVMCAGTGTVIALGPLEFEHTADLISGMSGGPVLTSGGEVIGLCEKGRIANARKSGVEISDDSRYLKVRKFAVPLHRAKWKNFFADPLDCGDGRLIN